ncbi:hypothetical protein [Aeromonas salmonicida]|uniref:hypothetical protein n=1 Tax=Aeromonas salmonicida TaxID=645 RepID=UPI00232F395A|nr:hypothetical protein [Aeromonas salmonicida]WCH27904.1 hypothetical protein ONZ66_03410 [Aeromonas salmonicida]
MKDIALALKDNIESRIKNGVIASVLIAWALWNWKGISVFLLSDKKDMIKIILGYNFSPMNDAVIPIAIGFAYVTIFQLAIYVPSYAAEIINNLIAKLSSKNTKQKLLLQREINDVAILSDFEYQKSVKMKELELISEKYKSLENNSLHLTYERDDAIRKLEECESSYKILTREKNELEFYIVESKGDIAKVLHALNIALEKTLDDQAKEYLTSMKTAINIIDSRLPGLRVSSESHKSASILLQPNDVDAALLTI